MPINFFKGHPSADILPRKELADAYSKILLETDFLGYENDPKNRGPLQYGTDSGNYEVRKTISDWNNREFNTDLSCPQNMNLTSGASYGAANILTSATSVEITQSAFIVTPTYFLINSSFVDAGFGGRIVPIRETQNEEFDIDIKTLENHLAQADPVPENEEINIIKDAAGRPDRKLYRHVIYMVPTFSNPGGISYTTKTRMAVLELARKYDMLIITDDVYELLDYTEASERIPRMVYLDIKTRPKAKTFGNTVSNATFSKILAPGIRFGWQETATSKLAEQLAITGANKSGGTPGQLSSFVVKSLIDNGTLDTIIKKFIEIYKERAKRLLEVIPKYLPSTTIVSGGDGGYFFWLSIPGEIDLEKVLDKMKERGVIIPAGHNFEVYSSEPPFWKNSVRLSISSLSPEKIEEGIRIWGDELRTLYPHLYQ